MLQKTIIKCLRVFVGCLEFVFPKLPEIMVLSWTDYIQTASNEYQKGIKAGKEYKAEFIHHSHIAYSIATTGYFNGPLFNKFIHDPKYRALLHRHWNSVAMTGSGFKTRIVG